MFKKTKHNNTTFIFLLGSVPGTGVLPEAGSSAAVSGEMPEGKQPGAYTAACRGGRPFRGTEVSP